MTKFFFGARPVEDGKVYAQVRMYSIKNPEKLIEDMEPWTTANSCNFTKTLIQAEVAVNIGWFIYSSQFTDTQLLAKVLKEDVTGYDWGFKLAAVTDSDKKDKNGKETSWRNRLKGMVIVVAKNNKDNATKIMEQNFGRKKNKAKRHSALIPFITSKLHYVPMEKDANAKGPEYAPRYSILKSRHTTFQNRVKADYITSLVYALDYDITIGEKETTLRQMIYNIKTTKGKRMFASVDHCEDSSKVFFDGSRGPGGPVTIFSFLGGVQMEARMMVKGLPVYLHHLYGRKIQKLFSLDHWEAVEEWEWDPSKKTFITPDVRYVEELVDEDSLFDMMSEDEKQETLHQNNPKQRQKDIAKAAEEALQMAMDTDEDDSLKSENFDKHHIKKVEFKNKQQLIGGNGNDIEIIENPSMTSAITCELKSKGSIDDQSMQSAATPTQKGSTKNPVVLMLETQYAEDLKDLFDPKKSIEENQETRQAFIKHKLNKVLNQWSHSASNQVETLMEKVNINDHEDKPDDRKTTKSPNLPISGKTAFVPIQQSEQTEETSEGMNDTEMKTPVAENSSSSSFYTSSLESESSSSSSSRSISTKDQNKGEQIKKAQKGNVDSEEEDTEISQANSATGKNQPRMTDQEFKLTYNLNKSPKAWRPEKQFLYRALVANSPLATYLYDLNEQVEEQEDYKDELLLAAEYYSQKRNRRKNLNRKRRTDPTEDGFLESASDSETGEVP